MELRVDREKQILTSTHTRLASSVDRSSRRFTINRHSLSTSIQKKTVGATRARARIEGGCCSVCLVTSSSVNSSRDRALERESSQKTRLNKRACEKDIGNGHRSDWNWVQTRFIFCRQPIKTIDRVSPFKEIVSNIYIAPGAKIEGPVYNDIDFRESRSGTEWIDSLISSVSSCFVLFLRRFIQNKRGRDSVHTHSRGYTLESQKRKQTEARTHTTALRKSIDIKYKYSGEGRQLDCRHPLRGR